MPALEKSLHPRIPLPVGNRRLVYLPLAFAGLVLAGILLIAAWQLRGAGELSVQYTTESGPGANQGAVNSPLRITVRVPWHNESPESNIAAIRLQLVDEKGNPAQFGGRAEDWLALQAAPE